ncbi:MAG: O-antigen ligase family protein [Streptosporangiaceae bacterium]|nr:O-antigen ligase family protein [Streptosporangiaceae bacterium]
MPMWLERDRERKLTLLCGAIVAGALIAACAGLLELALGTRLAGTLHLFRDKPTVAGGYLRLSGTFPYANVAAMYFELALPFSLVGLAHAVRRAPRRPAETLLWLLAADALLAATFLTFSRGAWLGLGIGSLAVLLAVGRRLEGRGWINHLRRHRRLVALGCLNLAVVGVSVLLPSHSLLLLRLTSQSDQEWYRASYTVRVPATLPARSQLHLPVTVQNLGPLTWTNAGPNRYTLSYHWLLPSGKFAVFDGLRSRLPTSVAPDGRQAVSALLQTPCAPGRYLLVWDMSQEGVTWFSLKSAVYRRIPVQIAAPPGRQTNLCAGGPVVSSAVSLPATVAEPGRPQLWGAALAMVRRHPLLGVGPDGFRLSYGAYFTPPLQSWDQRILANSLPLELLADVGMLGAGLFALFLALIVWPLIAPLPAGRAPSLWAIALIGALAAFVGHGLVDYMLENHAIFILFWIMCGLAGSLAAHDTERLSYADRH